MLTKEQIRTNLQRLDIYLADEEKYVLSYRKNTSECWVEASYEFAINKIILYEFLIGEKPQPKTRLLTQEDIINSSSPVWRKGNYGFDMIVSAEENGVYYFTNDTWDHIKWEDLSKEDIYINSQWQKGVMEI